MLIGIDASRATASERTGTENYSLFLIRALLELDQRNQYRLYLNGPPSPDLFPVAENVELRWMPFPRLWTHVRLSLEMAVRSPDVLFVPAHVLPAVHPRRSVVTIHDLGYLRYPEAHTRWSRWYLRWSTCYNARSAATVMVDSRATLQDLVKHCGTSPDKTHIVHPGCDPAFAEVRDEARVAEVCTHYGVQLPYLLFVGTLQPRKNLKVLLEAFSALVSHDAATHLALVGRKGWLYEPLFAQVRQLGLEHRVHFTGYVPQADLPAVISGAHAFVLPSLYEGFGLPVLEALACGTPVICSNVSSLPEVAGDAAILIDPHDTAQLTQAMQRVLENAELRREMALKGLRQARRFSWERCARETLTLIESAERGP
jgi:glycosyltransferase involved in cell wall biosynthesis